jgi:hypothetical protein
VNIPSERDALILSAHHWRPCAVAPQASSEVSISGTSEIEGDGCVGHVSSPVTSLCGTASSSTGSSGAPVRRSSTTMRRAVLPGEQGWLRGHVVVPQVVMHDLETADELAG